MELMSCAQACRIVADAAGKQDVVVITMSTMKTFPGIAPEALFVSCVPLMGGAGSLGMGIAVARPDLRVWVLDGDASLLMELGSLVSIAEAAPSNLVHVLCDNRVQYGGTANLALPRAGEVDFCAMAAAAGYARTLEAQDAPTFERIAASLSRDVGPTFIRARIAPDAPYYSQSTPQREIPDNQITRMGDEARRVRDLLAQRSQ